MKMKRFVCVAMLTVVSLGANAQQNIDKGFYIGGAAGISVGQFKMDDFTANTPLITETKDKTGTAFKLYGGYQIDKNLAVELTYHDLGKYTYDYVGNGGFAGLTATTSYSVTGLSLSGLYIIPLDNLSVFGRLGVARTTAKNSIVGSATAVISVPSQSASKTNAVLGLGATYNLAKNINLRFEYEYFGETGERGSSGRVNVRAFTLGAALRF